MSLALSSGDVNSVRDRFNKKKNLDLPIKNTLRCTQVIQRNVRGSEAEKDKLIPKFLRCACGRVAPLCFFTLNPHDIRSPLTLSLLPGDVRFEKVFSLDLSDVEAQQYMQDFLQDNPRKLHELVAGNPLAATRCFYWTVRLVLRTFFNCICGASLDRLQLVSCQACLVTFMSTC